MPDSILHHKRFEDTLTRMHLREEKKGQGILVVNANRLFHLNKTATAFVARIIDGKSDEEIVKELKKKFSVSKDQLTTDLKDIKNTLLQLTLTPDIDPVQRLSEDVREATVGTLSAPLRMDLALTYRCNNKCTKCYVDSTREIVELTTEEWKKVLDKLFEIGIPHVTFTGGEPTLREDLPKLVEYAEDLGILTGIISNGRMFKDKKLVDELVTAGIDHFQITIESHDPIVHNQLAGCTNAWQETVEGIKNIVPTPVYLMTNTTLTPYNVPEIEKTIEFLASLGIDHFACNGIISSGGGKDVRFALKPREMGDILDRISNKAEEKKMNFLWYSPTRYCEFNPIDHGLGMKQCTAGHIAMAIEPDGMAIPCQSTFIPLGNILTEKWKKIWNHKVTKELRNKDHLSTTCRKCSQVQFCGGGCPLNYEEKITVCKDSNS